MTKKVALCFYGQPRNIINGHKHIYQNMIKPNIDLGYEFDVFVHTWFNINDIGKHYINAGELTASSVLDSNVINSIYELYNPVKCLIEKQIEFEEKDYNNNKAQFIKPKYTLSKNFSVMSANSLKKKHEHEQKFKYDFCISTRFDFGMHSVVLLDELDPNFVTVSTQGIWQNYGIDVNTAYMSSELYDVYSEFVLYIDDIYRNHNIRFCDEPMMHKYFELKNIPFTRNEKLNNYTLLRS